jgi:hypothetical protein
MSNPQLTRSKGNRFLAIGQPILLAVVLLIALAWLFAPPTPDAKRETDSFTWAQLHLLKIALAIHDYADAHSLHLPPAAIKDDSGRPLLSWRVAILPYLGDDEKALYNQFRLDEPWDSSYNRALLQYVPAAYRSESPLPGEAFLTHYQVFVGPGTPFERPGLTWKDFPDGLYQTFLVMEAANPVPWSKPADMVYDPELPVPELCVWYRRTGPLPFGLGSRPITRYHASMCDGSIRTLKRPPMRQSFAPGLSAPARKSRSCRKVSTGSFREDVNRDRRCPRNLFIWPRL